MPVRTRAIVGGSARVSDDTNDYVVDTFPAGRTGWHATGYELVGDTMTVYAICAPAAQVAP